MSGIQSSQVRVRRTLPLPGENKRLRAAAKRDLKLLPQSFNPPVLRSVVPAPTASSLR